MQVSQWVSIAGVVGALGLFVMEVRRWRSPDAVVSAFQKRLRTILVILLETLLVMVFVAPWVVNSISKVGGLFYWTICLVIGLLVLLVVLLDLREVMREYVRMTRRISNELRDGAKHAQKRRNSNSGISRN